MARQDVPYTKKDPRIVEFLIGNGLFFFSYEAISRPVFSLFKGTFQSYVDLMGRLGMGFGKFASNLSGDIELLISFLALIGAFGIVLVCFTVAGHLLEITVIRERVLGSESTDDIFRSRLLLSMGLAFIISALLHPLFGIIGALIVARALQPHSEDARRNDVVASHQREGEREAQ